MSDFDERNIQGRIALVTGANRGVGKSVATALAARGATVLIVGRNAEAIQNTAKELGASVRAYVADTSDLTSIKSLADAVKADYGHIDVRFTLAHCVKLTAPLGSASRIPANKEKPAPAGKRALS